MRCFMKEMNSGGINLTVLPGVGWSTLAGCHYMTIRQLCA